ncbi:MAG: hypothetical protein A3B99_01570 [Candidatus Yanofskybacteria bacterium RIFCSPHIGHO2_02_FULL_44_12b]|uniref:HTH psq-type domain-containing protein n=2 Tax=Candidatus Yanofskyibacteriota TaxID=1752733 RepID=A0A1F8GKN4_9BACT|nr:MAG: hypothetical protein UW79_C0020G0020 [Candidatus Yanofskybacteria bacterium GW2011_GWA2_44_9]OGN04874.1 MAG: hypothetical protein A2659_04710 [Candidatus Yanofskybacteria bacterium RIFCSPHIGHO2_01_FULL_44_24]OGN16223.1 MAG: hypothetical protein A3B99_01570 [Candidatus Yanofskybacteria bacterium RIFCSPHIGHO2_02_FULL_44_12b]OGN25570.1 MAG: hypothetical protein A2925_05115 [Candidatus Yanofskybacteria bacterium RIFCSPLOWO2_01_FULL_44_22]
MHQELKEKAIQMRIGQQLGYGSIKAQIPVAKSTLSAWLRQFPLSEERILELRRSAWSKGEASREKFRNTMRAIRQKKDEKIYGRYLKRLGKFSKISFLISGLTLYLAEGSKTDYYNVSLANTDPRILRFFIKWLIYFFKLPRSKLRAQLHLYENMELEKEKEFWKNELCLKRGQFYKTYVSKLKKSSFLYKESFRHGTCSIKVSSSSVKREIMMGIKAYLDSIMRM